ncbi:MAG: helix-turn-helix transcriptional regulator [Lachnospiraceae bacterium]|nr:helix-turn-helix transcriptional regulator [Lachnospiraceae bacterium]
MENFDQLLYAPSDVALELAKRLKGIRKRKKITQQRLAARSNVSYASLCRFEQTGQISLESFIKLTMELGVIDEVKDLFTRPVYSSIEEVLNDKR